MRTLWQDIRFAARMLVRSPGFTSVVVGILALGIGANTAIFSVVNAVLLRPLPFREPQRLVEISTRFDDPEFARMLERAAQAMGITNGGNSTFDFREMRQRNHVFENVIAVAGPWLNVDVSGDEPRNVLGACVSGEFFSCLGIPILLGRTFLPEEDQPGTDQVVILGHQYWTQRFGADPDIIGKTISFKEGTYTVVGVLRPDFRFLEYGGISDTLAFFAEQGGLQDIQVWKPLALTPAKAGPSSLFSFGNFVLARLKPGVTVDQAQAELDVISRQLTQEFKQRGQRSLRVSLIQERLAAHVRPALWALSGTVAFVLLIVCANVANMLLARSIGRQREVVIRAALGAGRLRLVRQFLTESLLLSLLGGIAALFLTIWSLASLKVSLLSKMPRLSDIRVDGTVLCFTLAVSVLTGLLIGLAPILRLSGPALGRALKEGSLALGSAAHRAVLSRILLVSEVALSLILLIGAGLMVKSFWRLTHVDLGFDPKNVLVVDKRFDAPLLDRIRQLPGVETVAAGSSCINIGGSYNEFRIVGRDTAAGDEIPEAKCVPVTEDYFAALRIPLRAGRAFTANDHAKAERVAIVNEMIARRYLSDTSPLDQVLTCKGKSCRIVGVVGDIRPFGLRSEVMPMIYIPVSPTDPLTFACVSLTLIAIAVLASYLPARRAARIDPMVALRYE